MNSAFPKVWGRTFLFLYLLITGCRNETYVISADSTGCFHLQTASFIIDTFAALYLWNIDDQGLDQYPLISGLNSKLLYFKGVAVVDEASRAWMTQVSVCVCVCGS